MASRSQVADYVVGRLPGERKQAVLEAAAWLVDTGRARQAKYLAGDVARALSERGYVSAVVTIARALPESARAQIERYIKEQTGATQLELEMVVDPTVVGGALIELPGTQLDTTVKTKLAKFVQGVNE